MNASAHRSVVVLGDALANAIAYSPRPLADYTGIILDLSLAGYRAREIETNFDRAMVRAREMRTAFSRKR
jgi:hypothetical protein